MRNRLLLTLGVVLLGFVGFTGNAFAQEDEGGEEPSVAEEGETEADISHAAHECIELLEEGGNEPEDCHEAPSPILPATNELIWGAISFLVVFLVLAKFGFPAIKKGMEDAPGEDRGRSRCGRAGQGRGDGEGRRVRQAKLAEAAARPAASSRRPARTADS